MSAGRADRYEEGVGCGTRVNVCLFDFLDSVFCSYLLSALQWQITKNRYAGSDN